MDKDFQPDSETQTLNKLLNKFAPSVSDALEMMKKITADKACTLENISALDEKCLALQSHLVDFSNVILNKCHLQTIQGNSSLESFSGELRTALDRIRPRKSENKYQIGTLDKTALSGTIDPIEPHLFCATTDRLENTENLEEDENSGADEDGRHDLKKNAKPKAEYVSLVPNEDNKSRAVKGQKLSDRAKRALRSTVMKENCEEYKGTPVEVQIKTVELKNKRCKYDFERKNYEDDNLYRMPFTKKKQHRAK